MLLSGMPCSERWATQPTLKNACCRSAQRLLRYALQLLLHHHNSMASEPAALPNSASAARCSNMQSDYRCYRLCSLRCTAVLPTQKLVYCCAACLQATAKLDELVPGANGALGGLLGGVVLPYCRSQVTHCTNVLPASHCSVALYCGTAGHV
jgi:hypothetical protein